MTTTEARRETRQISRVTKFLTNSKKPRTSTEMRASINCDTIGLSKVLKNMVDVKLITAKTHQTGKKGRPMITYTIN